MSSTAIQPQDDDNNPSKKIMQEESKQMDDPDAIARRLRDKIRLQAESLLRQCDEQEEQLGSGSRRSSRAVSPSTTTAVNGSEQAPALDETENSESSELLASPSKGNLLQTTSNLLVSTSPAGAASSSGAATPTQAAPTSNNNNELTKRLQQLAVSRRQTLADNNSLRVIQADPTQTHLSSQTVQSFSELPLPDNLLKAVYAMGWDRPSQIQEAALPRILLAARTSRNHLIAQAPSGSGKTAAFALGMLFHCIVDDSKEIRTQALCVAPTRELAIQIVEQAVRPLAAVGMPAGFRVGLAIAGTNDWEPAHLWVGTPGQTGRRLQAGADSHGSLQSVCPRRSGPHGDGGRRAPGQRVAAQKAHARAMSVALFFRHLFPGGLEVCGQDCRRGGSDLVGDGWYWRWRQ